MFRTRRLAHQNKMLAKGTKQVRESAAVSDCTKISCVRKVEEPRIRKLSAYEIFWIYSIYIINIACQWIHVDQKKFFEVSLVCVDNVWIAHISFVKYSCKSKYWTDKRTSDVSDGKIRHHETSSGLAVKWKRLHGADRVGCCSNDVILFNKKKASGSVLHVHRIPRTARKGKSRCEVHWS